MHHKYAVIAQNGESAWDDVKGDLYHFPNTYQKILLPGCKIIYYKGKMTNKAFEPKRLSAGPHYFGVGVIGDLIVDPDSEKGDLFCEVLGFQEFDDAIPNKIDGEYLEEIPEARKSNYWRFGVREIDEESYLRILSNGKLHPVTPRLPNLSGDFESEAPVEMNKKQHNTSYYERLPYYRNKAIEIHGLSCQVCDFNFAEKYGELGKGFIHVHHNKPVSESGPTVIDPDKDLSVLCPNCHAMVHRKKGKTMSVQTLQDTIKDANGHKSSN